MTEEGRLPVQLTRADLDRVIRRAAELQFHEGTGDPDGALLSEEEVLRIGGEVGIEAAHMRRALGEVRAEALVPALPVDTSPLRGMIGEGRLRAERVVPGDATDVEQRLVRWLSDVESLQAVRRRAGVSLWEPAEGLVAQLKRGLKWGGQRYEFARAKQVEVSVQELEEGFSLVTVTVDVRNIRSEQGGGAALGFGFGGLAAGVALGVTLLPVVGAIGAGMAGVALGSAGGIAVGRSAFQQRAERLRLAAEGLLDRLERGELVPPAKKLGNFSPPRT